MVIGCVKDKNSIKRLNTAHTAFKLQSDLGLCTFRSWLVTNFTKIATLTNNTRLKKQILIFILTKGESIHAIETLQTSLVPFHELEILHVERQLILLPVLPTT